MKKLLLVGASLSCFTFVAADDSACGGISSGFYVGGGISFINDGTKEDIITPDSYEYEGEYVTHPDEYEGAYPYKDEDGNWVANGIVRSEEAGGEIKPADNDGRANFAIDNENHTLKLRKGKKLSQVNFANNRIGGTALFGFQKVLSKVPVCFGIEVGSDFGHCEHLTHGKINKETDYDLTIKHSNCTPFAALRIGYVHNDNQLMPYFKVGISRSEVKEEYQGNLECDLLEGYQKEHASSSKFSSWKPTFAIGLEKSIGKNLAGRLEFEYRLSKTKTKHFSEHSGMQYIEDENNNGDLLEPAARDAVWYYTEVGGKKKITQKGSFTVRALVTYNVRM